MSPKSVSGSVLLAAVIVCALSLHFWQESPLMFPLFALSFFVGMFSGVYWLVMCWGGRK